MGTAFSKSPDWLVVEKEIRSLDGHLKDSLTLDLDDGRSYMGVAGGRNNQYVVAGYLEGYGAFISASGIESTNAVDVVVCGDFNQYAAMNVVDLESVIARAKEFYNKGELALEFRWEKDRRQPKSRTNS